MGYKYINTEYLEMVAGGDPELIKEITLMFREQVAEMFEGMKAHLAAKNYEELGLLAHKAKSSVAIMGMNELADVLKTFELKAREGTDTGSYEEYVERFGRDTISALSELEDVISKL